jgi:hypothetical protein
MVLQGGKVFDKAGVNTSISYGTSFVSLVISLKFHSPSTSYDCCFWKVSFHLRRSSKCPCETQSFKDSFLRELFKVLYFLSNCKLTD